MKIVLSFDSYKGCLSAAEVCKAARKGILSVCPAAEVHCLPMSDGGEGLVESLMATAAWSGMALRRVTAHVHGPLMEDRVAAYAISEDGSMAVMEMASACGLPLVPLDRRDPTRTTTYGLGEMMADAVRRGVQHIVLGIGGSATCDAGRGMLEALRCQLTMPWGVRLSVACDVRNPLFGPDGAAYVFAPQKGATPQQVEWLDAQLRRFARETEDKGLATPCDALLPGTGAAGGLGYALLTYLKAELKPGIEVALDALRFDEVVQSADCVLTGEGCSDRQTLMGKVPQGVLQRAQRQGVPVVLMSGAIRDAEVLHDAGFQRIVCINEGDSRPLEVLLSPHVASENITQAVRLIM